MTNPADTDAERAALIKTAETAFIREGLRLALTANYVNRFHVNWDGPNSIIVLGSVGVLAGASDEDETPPPAPIMNVAGTFRSDIAFLRSLAKVIQEILPPEEDGDVPAKT